MRLFENQNQVPDRRSPRITNTGSFMALVEQSLSGFRSKVNISSLQDQVELRQPYRLRSEAAFTLAELVIALAIAVLALSGVITGYILAANRAEWSAYS